MSERTAITHRGGFTLVEFLPATLLGALVVIVSLAVFVNVTRNHQSIQLYSELLGQGRYGLNAIRRDLANFHHSVADGQTRLIGVDGQSSDGDTDRMLIRVDSGFNAKREESGGGVYEVEYGLMRRQGEDGIFLARRSRRIAGGTDGEQEGMISYIAGDVTQLRFAYFDGQQWQGRWEQSRLPVLVRVELILSDQEKRVSDVPISQIVSVSHLTSAAIEDGMDERTGDVFERHIPAGPKD